MGYDMDCVDPAPQEEVNAVKAARAAFYAACRARDALERDTPEHAAAQEEVMAASRAMSDLDRNSFRLNIWGMARAREIMDAAGMLKDGHPSQDDWPELDLPEDIQDAAMEAVDDDGNDVRSDGFWQECYGTKVGLSDQAMEAAREYKRLRRIHLTAHDRDTPGIAYHKLYSNDGWYVTPFEIEWALKAWDKLGREAQLELIGGENPEDHYFWSWIEYLRTARNRGGFRVF